MTALKADKLMAAELALPEVKNEIHNFLESYSFDLDSRRLVIELLLGL